MSKWIKVSTKEIQTSSCFYLFLASRCGGESNEMENGCLMFLARDKRLKSRAFVAAKTTASFFRRSPLCPLLLLLLSLLVIATLIATLLLSRTIHLLLLLRLQALPPFLITSLPLPYSRIDKHVQKQPSRAPPRPSTLTPTPFKCTSLPPFFSLSLPPPLLSYLTKNHMADHS